MIKAMVAGMTCSTPDTIESTVPLTAYGVDSLMSQEIISWAEKKLRITLEQSQVFGGLTVAQLVSMAI
jgi:acyl carrier protein